jgi:DNA-directed RNA polymerase specialized sigma24 family protein
MSLALPNKIQILRAQTGDLQAYDAVLKAIQQPLYRYLVRLTGDAVLAKDVLQEVFLIIFRKLPTLTNPELFRAWFFRLASREAFRYLKKQHRWHFGSCHRCHFCSPRRFFKPYPFAHFHSHVGDMAFSRCEFSRFGYFTPRKHA